MHRPLVPSQPRPLAVAYSRACKDMLMDGCQPWTAFCAQETPAAAQAVCVPRSQWVLPDDARCLADPTQPECASYTYPDNSTRADMDRLCRSMPDMPGCSIRRECEKVRGGGRVVAGRRSSRLGGGGMEWAEQGTAGG